MRSEEDAMTAVNGTVSILVAEDDPDDVTFFEEAIRRIGLRVEATFFENGRRLIESLRHRGPPPDLIFLDINMPEMDGREACEEILSDPGLNTVPVIILTTSDDESDRTYFLSRGAKSFVTKPSNLDSLSLLLRGLLNQWGGASRPCVWDCRRRDNLAS